MYHSSWVTVKKSLEFSGVEKICGSSSTGASFGILRSGNFKALQLWGQWIIFRLRGIFGIGSSAASPSKLYVLNLVCFSCPCFFFPLPDERAELNCYPNYSCIATVFLPSVVSVIGVLWVWESLEEQSFLNIFLLCWMLSAWICFGWIANCHLEVLVWIWWHHFWIKEKLGKDYTFHCAIWISGWTWSLDDCSCHQVFSVTFGESVCVILLQFLQWPTSFGDLLLSSWSQSVVIACFRNSLEINQ